MGWYIGACVVLSFLWGICKSSRTNAWRYCMKQALKHLTARDSLISSLAIVNGSSLGISCMIAAESRYGSWATHELSAEYGKLDILDTPRWYSKRNHYTYARAQLTLHIEVIVLTSGSSVSTWMIWMEEEQIGRRSWFDLTHCRAISILPATCFLLAFRELCMLSLYPSNGLAFLCQLATSRIGRKSYTAPLSLLHESARYTRRSPERDTIPPIEHPTSWICLLPRPWTTPSYPSRR